MENFTWGNEIIRTRHIREYAQEIIKETCGYITDPEHQAVIMTVYDIINYLQGEYELDYLERYDELWDEDGELIGDIYSKKFDEIWNEDGAGEYQEVADDYSGMTTWAIEIGDGYYFVGNIEDLRDDSILGYASWFYDEEDEED